MGYQPKIVRIIARLNVGGPAKHVVWLTAGLDDFDTLLVAGSVPAGEGDLGHFALQSGVLPHFIPQMSREISMGDITTIWKLYRLYLREKPDLIHTHTAKAGTVGRVAGFFYRWLTPSVFLGTAAQDTVRSYISWPHLPQLLWSIENAAICSHRTCTRLVNYGSHRRRQRTAGG
jgi:hypothetical protein